MMKILIVEDERVLNNGIALVIENNSSNAFSGEMKKTCIKRVRRKISIKKPLNRAVF